MKSVNTVKIEGPENANSSKKNINYCKEEKVILTHCRHGWLWIKATEN